MAERTTVKGVEYVRLFSGDRNDEKFMGLCDDVANIDATAGINFSGLSPWTAAEIAAKPESFRRVIQLFMEVAYSKSVREALVLVDGLLWAVAPGNEKLRAVSVMEFNADDDLREAVLFCHRLAVELESIVSKSKPKRMTRGNTGADIADSGVEEQIAEKVDTLDPKKSGSKPASPEKSDSTVKSDVKAEQKPADSKPAEKPTDEQAKTRKPASGVPAMKKAEAEKASTDAKPVEKDSEKDSSTEKKDAVAK